MTSEGLEPPPDFKGSYSSSMLEADRIDQKSKAPLLPDLSASTQKIIARVQAESGGGTTSAPPILPQSLRTATISTGDHPPSDAISKITAQFQSPRMAPGIFDKSKLKSAFASALIPKSKTLPSQPVTDSTKQPPTVDNTSASRKDDSQSVTAPNLVPESSIVGPSSRRSHESTIEVMPSPGDSPVVAASTAGQGASSKSKPDKLETPKPKMRMNHTYVLPSGEIVNSGKGLGRGRPGIKRGPRKPKSATATPLETKPTSRKRKRSSTLSDVERGQDSRSGSPSASDSGEEYAPQATQTRSGRHTQRPATFVPSESPSQNRSPLNASSSKNVAKPSLKRKGRKGKEQSALCEHCLRGYGPPKNSIVFCDGCNRCWHQKCHDPEIPRKLVVDPNSGWFCNECAVVKQKADKIADKAAGTQEPEAPAPAPPPPADTTRKDYFNSLTKESLVELVMQASTLAPHLPLWQPPPRPPSPPLGTTTATPRSSSSNPREEAYPTPQKDPSDDGQEDDDNDEDDDDDDYRDEHAKLYPKPGNGVQLPPESEDVDMLLEGPENRTFSHSLREPVAEVEGGV